MAEVPNIVPALPEIFLALAAMTLLMLGVFQKPVTPDGELRAARTTTNLGLITMVLALLLVFTVSGNVLVTFEGMFISDPFATFAKVLILIASTFSLMMAQRWLEQQHAHRFEFAVLVILATLGMMMMVSASNLLSLYMGLELQSLSLYVLAAFQRDDVRSTESGLKYFVLGAMASAFLLYGSSLVYGFTGTTDFATIAATIKAQDHHFPTGLAVGLVFVMAGLAFKVSAVPFHMWTPDVYEGAPTPVTSFFAVAPKVAALALFLRVMMGPFGEMAHQWQGIVVLLSILSMSIGAFAAIAQVNIKRMMAYSSIGHVGYALMGLAVANEQGVTGVLIYLAIYVFMNVGVFACILAMRRGDRMVESIYDLAGLAKSHPGMAAALAVFMFSMAGIPPLAGFFGKLYIFLAAIEAQLYTLAIIGVLTSVVSAYYYLRIIKIMYFDEAEADHLETPLPNVIAAVLGVCSAVIVLFFLVPAPLITTAGAAAASLF
ncbi:MAG: NADH-quinone oxidoreductase subunit NuoN [Alphaproteobacteria bacterium]|nr:NADH-quinone oxidoreductase subunit NuoN [Alphaproteobacteria bacterium]MBF0249501.1 NADH-quinone oxidoreductase subunit NuoN [Alphaproteobacteria bacterium]